MTIFIICLLSVIFLFLLFIFPLNTKIKLHIDFFGGKAFYSIKILWVKILVGTTYLYGGKIVIQNTHNLIFKEDKNIRQKEVYFIEEIVKQINISKLELYFDGGIKSNPFASAMICGNIDSIFCGISAYVITRHPLSHIIVSVSPDFQENTMELSVQSLLEISLLNIVVALIKGKRKYKEN